MNRRVGRQDFVDRSQRLWRNPSISRPFFSLQPSDPTVLRTVADHPTVLNTRCCKSQIPAEVLLPGSARSFITAVLEFLFHPVRNVISETTFVNEVGLGFERIETRVREGYNRSDFFVLEENLSLLRRGHHPPQSDTHKLTEGGHDLGGEFGGVALGQQFVSGGGDFE